MNSVTALLEALPHRRYTLVAGQTLFHRGAVADRLFVVLRGRLRLIRHTTTGQVAVLQVAGPGELLAEAALGASHFHCDAVAESDAELLGYPRAAVEGFLQEHPGAALAWIGLQAQRIQRLRSLLALHRQRSAPERVLGYLRLLADPHGVVALSGSLRELAEEIGLSPEAFYRTLARLEQQGRVQRTEGAVRLLEPYREEPP